MNDKLKELDDVDFQKMAADDELHFNNFKIHIADVPLVIAFAFLFLVVLVQFFSRYVLNDSISWTEEAARYLLTVIAFAGAIRCQIKGTHIVLEFMDKHFGEFKPWITLFALMLTFIIMLVFMWSIYVLIQRTSFQQMVSLPFPKYYLYVCVMGLVFINTIAIGQQIINHIKLFKKEA
jgi:TRAP-type C4-dicarboxylate transport system permease small subunit